MCNSFCNIATNEVIWRVVPPTIKPVLQQVISSNSSKTLFTRSEGNPGARVNYKHRKNKKLCSVYDDNIFPFFR